tara:strand:+ start:651 stop:839 length:189 start_codon:yes stop_codon:yes gene_type:complete
MPEVRIVSTPPGCKVLSIKKLWGDKYEVRYRKPSGNIGLTDMDFNWGKKSYKSTNGWEATYT